MLVVGLASLIAVGGVGLYGYANSFWVYRGYTQPQEPRFVTIAGPRPRVVRVFRGTHQLIHVLSAAVGPKPIQVEVILPPGYSSSSNRRYPVFYFLHGLPGEMFTYRTVLQGLAVEDVLIAQRRLKPMIVVVPGGPWRGDTEWADGIRPVSGWDTFVSRDLVRAIDRRFRTIPRTIDRAIAGLSEGGYGALNIGLHHPEVFGTIESWSGYTIADPTSGVFGTDARLLEYDSPLRFLPNVVQELRRYHTLFWFYVGIDDRFFHQNLAFADELTKFRIPHFFFSAVGGHSWPLWRHNLGPALIVASWRMTVKR